MIFTIKQIYNKRIISQKQQLLKNKNFLSKFNIKTEMTFYILTIFILMSFKLYIEKCVHTKFSFNGKLILQ